MHRFACQCCGNLSLRKPGPGSNERCPICYWIDDLHQFQNPSDMAGPNPVSLFAGRNNYEAIGACDPSFLDKVTPAAKNRVRPIWVILALGLPAAFFYFVTFAPYFAHRPGPPGTGMGLLIFSGPIYFIEIPACLLTSACFLAALIALHVLSNRSMGKWGKCKLCGYDLSGLRTRRCPECGEAF